MEEWNEKINVSSWLHGVHIQSAVAFVLCKNTQYPKKTFDLFSADMPEKQKIQSSEDAMKKRSKQINEILARNEQYSHLVLSKNRD